MSRLFPYGIALLLVGCVLYFRSDRIPSPEPVQPIVETIGKLPETEVLPLPEEDALHVLRAAFETDQSIAKRLKLQSKLARQWQNNLHVDQPVHEITDRKALRGYRAYLRVCFASRPRLMRVSTQARSFVEPSQPLTIPVMHVRRLRGR